MHNILTVSKLTLKESVSSRLFIGLLIFLLLFLGFSIYISTLSLGTVGRFIENTGMLGISLVCLAVSILFGLYSLYQEKERNELYVLLNRVSRPAYILGRFFGTVLIIIMFSTAAGTGVFLLTWAFGQRFSPEIFWAVYWAILEFSLLSSIGMLFYAMGVGFTLNSIMILSVFVVGHSLTEAVQSFAALGMYGSTLHFMLVKAISYIFPNFDMFDFRLAIVHSEQLPAGKVVLSTCYCFFYLVAVLAASSAAMKKRDI
jgi:hypothetical protein